MNITITYDMLENARTHKGGYTNAQVKMAQGITESRKPIASLHGMSIPITTWNKFESLKSKKPIEKKAVFKITPDWLVEYSSDDLINQYQQSKLVRQENNRHWQLYSVGTLISNAKRERFESLK